METWHNEFQGSNWPEEITEWLNTEGELPLVIENIDLKKLPDVWPHRQTCGDTGRVMAVREAREIEIDRLAEEDCLHRKVSNGICLFCRRPVK